MSELVVVFMFDGLYVAWSVCVVPLCLRPQKSVGTRNLDSLKCYAHVNLFKSVLMHFLPSIYEQEAVNDGAGQQEKVG
jgi:hypothetical protein